jgi:hypothetical protein
MAAAGSEQHYRHRILESNRSSYIICTEYIIDGGTIPTV